MTLISFSARWVLLVYFRRCSPVNSLPTLALSVHALLVVFLAVGRGGIGGAFALSVSPFALFFVKGTPTRQESLLHLKRGVE